MGKNTNTITTFDLRGKTQEVYEEGVLETFEWDGETHWEWHPFDEAPRKTKWSVRIEESPFWRRATRFMLIVNIFKLLKFLFPVVIVE